MKKSIWLSCIFMMTAVPALYFQSKDARKIQEASYILGAQGLVWSEHIKSATLIEYIVIIKNDSAAQNGMEIQSISRMA
jgi:N-acetyl-beta-hexosaminidase